MKRIFLLVLLCFLLSVPSRATVPWTTYSPSLKVTPELWRMKTKAEVQKLVPKVINNPRAVYYFINQAHKRGLEVEAATAFRAIETKHPNPSDPKWRLTYAYVMTVAAGPRSRQWFSTSSTGQKLVSDYGLYAATVIEDIERYKNSPELLVMAGRVQAAELYMGTFNYGMSWRRLFSWYQRASKLAPRWADAYYGHGDALHDYALRQQRKVTPAVHKRYLAQAEKYLLRAQKLDPGLKGNCALRLAAIAEDQNQLQKELKYIDVLFATYPTYRKIPYWSQRRRTVIEEIQAAKNE